MIPTSLVPSEGAEALHDVAENLGTRFCEGEKRLKREFPLISSLCINIRQSLFRINLLYHQ
uniref:Testis cDNA clone: QtsA-12747, similar to human RAN guanine nucleotide release factor (RANGNRF) n=1 Tax=Macaca fascicularis TaxID=9541 RepID=Q4R418_MACFA|nr:unnamed protein product [Macaca fascicularis]